MKELRLPLAQIWVRNNAIQRVSCVECVFVTTNYQTYAAYKIGVAMQQPYTVWVSILTYAEHDLALSSTCPEFTFWHRHDFRATDSAILNIWDATDVEPQCAKAIPGFAHQG